MAVCVTDAPLAGDAVPELDLVCNGSTERGPWEGIFCHPACYGVCYTGQK